MAPYKKKRVWNFSVDVTVPVTATGGARKKLRAIHDNVRKHAAEQRKAVVDTLSEGLQEGIEVRAAYAWQVLRHVPALSEEERLQRSAVVRAALEENDQLRRRLELQLAQIRHEEMKNNETVMRDYLAGIAENHTLCTAFENYPPSTINAPIERDVPVSRALAVEEEMGETVNPLPDIVNVGSPPQASAYNDAREHLIGEYLDDRRVLKALILRTENMLNFFARHMI